MPHRPDQPAQYWKTVLDTIPDALMIMSPAGEIVSVNRATEKITGYSAGELLGASCTLLDCTGCERFAKGEGPRWCRLYKDGKLVSKRCTITTKDGRKLDVVKRATVLKDEDGELVGAVEAFSDISEVAEKEREIISLREILAAEDGFMGMIGHSPAMRGLFDLVENAAHSQAPVLIFGESGTGKELVARAIHKLGPRSENSFIKVNCAALNQNLLETELFGHVKGAFTGADRERVGRFQAAHKGDIFLDEIGDVPLPTQVKLLRVLEEKEIERVGDHRPIPVDVRLITATHRDLGELMKDGRFREDFFYRINVVPIAVPALRQRREDIPILAQSFVQRLSAKTGKPIGGFTSQALELLYGHHWPGNVRELKNAIEYAFVLCHEGEIDTRHLPDRLLEAAGAGQAAAPSDQSARPQSRTARPARGKKDDQTQREELIAALKQSRGNQSQAARILGVSRMTIWKRMKKYQISLQKDVCNS